MVKIEHMWTVIHTEASPAWGGQEIRILREALGMRERGHRVVIVAQPESDLLQKTSQQGFETVAISFEKRDWPTTLRRLLTLFKRIRPDVVNTHSSKDSWIAGIAARISNLRPVLVRTRHLSTPISKSFLSAIVYKGLTHKIVTTGEAIREQLIERNNVPRDHIISIPTGVDLERFDPTKEFRDIRLELSLAADTPLIGMVSVLRSWKGHDYLIEAAQRIHHTIPEVRFLIVGDGPRREVLEATIREKDLSDIVLMPGHREDVPDIIASLDILVHPSYANEGIPQTLLQGLAMKTPIISSDLKPLLEVIRDGETGLTVPVKDPSALVDKIEMLLRDNDLKETLVNNGGEHVKNFSKEMMLDLTEGLYKALI
jgi:glycosyltransferase involved in cell wall biosynthesis